MPTKAELKVKRHPKLKLRAGDEVMIISGKDKGQVGYIYSVDPEKQKAIVLRRNEENPDQPLPLNAVVKNKRARLQGEKSARFVMPSPVHISNLMALDPKDGSPSRVGRKREGGKIVRYAKKSGEALPSNKIE